MSNTISTTICFWAVFTSDNAIIATNGVGWNGHVAIFTEKGFAEEYANQYQSRTKDVPTIWPVTIELVDDSLPKRTEN